MVIDVSLVNTNQTNSQVVAQSPEPTTAIGLILGIGNPDEQFEGTRHNVGRRVVREFALGLGIDSFSTNKKCQALVARDRSSEVLLAQSLVYMNQSGQVARALIDYYKLAPEQLCVVHDDLDLAVGQHKMQFARGPKTHNGLLSIYQHIGTRNIWHLRVGVDGRGENRTIAPKEYVLQRFLGAEQATLATAMPSITASLRQRLSSLH